MISLFGVHSAASGGKIENGSGAILDDDLRHLLRQPLAGAQVERHVRPAPGAHIRLQRDEGLGLAAFRTVEVGDVAGHRLAVDRALRVLAAHRLRQQPRAARSAAARAAPSASRRAPDRRPATPAAPSRPGTAAAACGSAPCRAARRSGRSSRRAAPRRRVSATVICTWSITSAIPQPLEDRVGEAQRQQVLHRLLAEVVVDAEDLRLAEHRADLVVDLARRGEVVADRLFQHDARLLGDQAVRADVAADRADRDRATWRDRRRARARHRAVREHMPVRLGPSRPAGT